MYVYIYIDTLTFTQTHTHITDPNTFKLPHNKVLYM